ncbi:MAG: hypothetical protein JJU29_23300 [Verrucomicrobia bacterium]|nr:hypothetical protein [Verrucomicrobiota bacterium]MCH8514351.1 hypothetical protein [Kiritimatiellia bacterium]
MRADENPFRTANVHALPFLWPDGVTPDTLVRDWEALGRSGAICGPHGNGKSTLLREWTDHLAGLGWEIDALTLTEEFPRLPRGFAAKWKASRPKTVAVLDGAEQLTRWQRRIWMQATRNAGGRVITCHAPLFLPVLLRVKTSAAQLETLLGMIPGAPEVSEKPGELLQRFGGDVRLVFRYLYDA